MAYPECSHSCGGVCCRDFVMSHSPERIGELYLAAVARIVAFEDTEDDWDKVFTVEMLVRIDDESDENGPRYSCVHFRADVGLCGVYDERPWMCRSYPNGRPCYHCGFSNAPPDEAAALVQIASPKETEHDRAA
ncbi:MAG: YkgJ family cysteine cluster protein [Gemmatimonadales bacterium]